MSQQTPMAPPPPDPDNPPIIPPEIDQSAAPAPSDMPPVDPLATDRRSLEAITSPAESTTEATEFNAPDVITPPPETLDATQDIVDASTPSLTEPVICTAPIGAIDAVTPPEVQIGAAPDAIGPTEPPLAEPTDTAVSEMADTVAPTTEPIVEIVTTDTMLPTGDQADTAPDVADVALPPQDIAVPDETIVAQTPSFDHPAPTVIPPAFTAAAEPTIPLPTAGPAVWQVPQQAPQAGQQYGYATQPVVPGQPAAPGQPYLAAPTAAPPYGGYGPALAPQTPPPAKNRTGLIILIGVLVLALAGLGIYWFVLRGGANPGVDNTPTPTEPTVVPESAVQDFLNALAKGDADTALTYAAAPPANPTYLTNAVLAASIAANPITNIVVTPDPVGDSTQAHVGASYKIGSTPVTTSYDVKLYGDRYLISNVTKQVNLASAFTANIGMALNGVSMDRSSLSSVELFPGSYQLTTTNSLLELYPDQFIVSDATSPVSVATTAMLSDTAPSVLADAAKSALNKCLTEKVLVTSCNFGFAGLQGNATPNLSTISWKITSGSDDFSGVDFQQSPASPTTAGGNVTIKIRCNVRDTKGNQYQASVTIGAVIVDFTDPNDIQVTFSK